MFWVTIFSKRSVYWPNVYCRRVIRYYVYHLLQATQVHSLRRRHFVFVFSLNPGEQGWRSGESTRLPPSNVARVRFSDPVSYASWVCWFSSLLREVFLRVLRFSPLPKNQHFSHTAPQAYNFFLWSPSLEDLFGSVTRHPLSPNLYTWINVLNEQTVSV